MKDCILILLTSPQLEEDIVDWLLEQDEITGFTSNPVYGQSREQKKLSIVEQVIGRHRSVMFHIQLDMKFLDQILLKMQQEFAGTNLEYWVLPVIKTGRLAQQNFE